MKEREGKVKERNRPDSWEGCGLTGGKAVALWITSKTTAVAAALASF